MTYATTIHALTLFILAGAQPLDAQTGYDLLVSSRGTSSVKRYDGVTGAYLGDLVAPGAGGLSVTQEVRQAADGSLLVTGRGNSAVLRFDRRTGQALGPFTSGYLLDQPTKTTQGPDGRLYVSQWGQVRSSVASFDGTTGQFIREATPSLNQPMQHLVEPDGSLLVVNFGSRDVLRFSVDGQPVGPATSGKALQGPVNLWRHPSGDLLVLDWQAGTVERFDGQTGAFKQTFLAGFTTAEGWTIGPDGALYIADWSQNTVSRFDAGTGAPLGVFASGGGLSQPNSLLFVERTPDFSIATSPRTVEVPAGTTARVDVTVTADRGLAFPEPVALRCLGLPAGWSCSFDRPDARPGAGTDTVGLTIRTSGLAGMPLAALAVLAAIALGRSPTLRRPAPLVLLTLGCGGTDPSPGPVARTFTIVVEGRGDGLERSASLAVTVNLQ